MRSRTSSQVGGKLYDSISCSVPSMRLLASQKSGNSSVPVYVVSLVVLPGAQQHHKLFVPCQVPRYHDSSIITMNLNQMEQVEKSVQRVEDKVKSDLQSSILANGKIKAGRRTSYKFDEDVISELRRLKTKLVSTR